MGIKTNSSRKWIRSRSKGIYSEVNGGSGGLYEYGWPAAGELESDVVCQFLFEESSATLFDEVYNIGATPKVSGAYPAYSQSVGGDWVDLSPGVAYHKDAWHEKTVPSASLGPDTSDVTFECVAKIDNGATANGYVWTTMDSAAASGGVNFIWLTTPQFWISTRSSTNTVVTTKLNDTIGVNDGQIRKYRIVMERSVNQTLYVDGNSLGSGNIASMSGGTIPNYQLGMGMQYNSGDVTLRGTLYEWRQSNNKTNNSGGPGGG